MVWVGTRHRYSTLEEAQTGGNVGSEISQTRPTLRWFAGRSRYNSHNFEGGTSFGVKYCDRRELPDVRGMRLAHSPLEIRPFQQKHRLSLFPSARRWWFTPKLPASV